MPAPLQSGMHTHGPHAHCLQVGVEDAMLKGRVRITLRPLLYRIPVVGAIQASRLGFAAEGFDWGQLCSPQCQEGCAA